MPSSTEDIVVEATRSRVAKVVAVVFAVGAITVVVWWAQSRGERVAAMSPTPVQQRSLRPDVPPAAPVPTPPSILADRPVPTPPAAALDGLTRGSALQDMDGRMRDPAIDQPERDTYFSTSKSAFAPSFDEPPSEHKDMHRRLEEAMKAPFDVPQDPIAEPGPDAR